MCAYTLNSLPIPPAPCSPTKKPPHNHLSPDCWLCNSSHPLLSFSLTLYFVLLILAHSYRPVIQLLSSPLCSSPLLSSPLTSPLCAHLFTAVVAYQQSPITVSQRNCLCFSVCCLCVCAYVYCWDTCLCFSTGGTILALDSHSLKFVGLSKLG